ncbi:hypothetical protein GUJ93_ZPchr0002g24731 [Zizania palustris]|uniref:Secreted protein n=1 Tax=Zizania palustris TaxID=103762 RepID=A0A8J5SH25_ZIZPA|nr:hypothetical protein GUJ93_ZPchr0002g24731 [Zizania palustris]
MWSEVRVAMALALASTVDCSVLRVLVRASMVALRLSASPMSAAPDTTDGGCAVAVDGGGDVAVGAASCDCAQRIPVRAPCTLCTLHVAAHVTSPATPRMRAPDDDNKGSTFCTQNFPHASDDSEIEFQLSIHLG